MWDRKEGFVQICHSTKIIAPRLPYGFCFLPGEALPLWRADKSTLGTNPTTVSAPTTPLEAARVEAGGEVVADEDRLLTLLAPPLDGAPLTRRGELGAGAEEGAGAGAALTSTAGLPLSTLADGLPGVVIGRGGGEKAGTVKAGFAAPLKPAKVEAPAAPPR